MDIKLEGLTAEQADVVTAAIAVANASVAYFKANDALERQGPGVGRTEAVGATYKTLRAAADRYDDVSETWRVVKAATAGGFGPSNKDYHP